MANSNKIQYSPGIFKRRKKKKGDGKSMVDGTRAIVIIIIIVVVVVRWCHGRISDGYGMAEQRIVMFAESKTDLI